jgi:CDP-diacylglycerol--glycerol-3-phosphate 3-phosphatidyltransferase
LKAVHTIGRRVGTALLTPPARFIGRLGISPTVFTFLGLALGVGAGVAFGAGRLRTGALLVLAAGLTDMFDGAVARACGRVSRFGAFIDSVLDRYSEAAYLTGLAYFYAARAELWPTLLVVLLVSGSIIVSYAKARAESLRVSCDVGVMERPERMVLLAVGYLVGGRGAVAALVLLAVFSHLTAFQRIIYTWRRLRSAPPAGGEGADDAGRGP